MNYKLLADMVVLLHLAFILFVVLGGLLVLKWRKLAWVHIPLAIWGAVVEFANLICPLTHLEYHLRQLGGEENHASDFVEHYIIPILYPAGLDFQLQVILGSLVVVVNIIFYGFVVSRYRRWRK